MTEPDAATGPDGVVETGVVDTGVVDTGAKEAGDRSPARNDGIDMVEQQLGALFGRVRASATQAARQIHPELGTGAYPILLRIFEAAPVRITDLAAYFGVGKPTMSRQVGSLERLGLVVREADPADGRGALVSLTDDGRREFAMARRRRHDWMVTVLDGFSDGEIEEFGRLLRRFVSMAL